MRIYVRILVWHQVALVTLRLVTRWSPQTTSPCWRQHRTHNLFLRENCLREEPRIMRDFIGRFAAQRFTHSPSTTLPVGSCRPVSSVDHQNTCHLHFRYCLAISTSTRCSIILDRVFLQQSPLYSCHKSCRFLL